jgi:hypothetical protein
MNIRRAQKKREDPQDTITHDFFGLWEPCSTYYHLSSHLSVFK